MTSICPIFLSPTSNPFLPSSTTKKHPASPPTSSKFQPGKYPENESNNSLYKKISINTLLPPSIFITHKKKISLYLHFSLRYTSLLSILLLTSTAETNSLLLSFFLTCLRINSSIIRNNGRILCLQLCYWRLDDGASAFSHCITDYAMETYLSRSLGFSLLTIGLLSLLLTGSVPLTSSFADAASTRVDDPTAPYAFPTLMITLLYHAGTAFFCYIMWNEVNTMAYGISAIVGGILASIGVWCVLFASSDGRISRKTGADKRTSGFPFKNREADKRGAKKKL